MNRYFFLLILFFSNYAFAIMDGYIPANFCTNYGDINIIALNIIAIHIFIIYLTFLILINNYHIFSKLLILFMLVIWSSIAYREYIRVDLELLILLTVLLYYYGIVLVKIKKLYIPISIIVVLVLVLIYLKTPTNNMHYGCLVLTVIVILSAGCLNQMASSKKIKNDDNMLLKTLIFTVVVIIFLTIMGIMNFKYHEKTNDYTELGCYFPSHED